MTRENAERVRRVYDAFNGRDLDGFLALMDDEVVAESRLATMEGGYRGHEGIRRWWEDLLDVFPDYTIAVEEITEHGDVVITRFTAHGHGTSSDTPLVDPRWHAARWRDGRCVWWRVCADEAEARAAAGLSAD